MTAVYSLLLFLSGMTALILEVAWFRRLAQLVGGTSIALAGVLAAVIGGMAIGAFFFGALCLALGLGVPAGRWVDALLAVLLLLLALTIVNRVRGALKEVAR